LLEEVGELEFVETILVISYKELIGVRGENNIPVVVLLRGVD